MCVREKEREGKEREEVDGQRRNYGGSLEKNLQSKESINLLHSHG